MIRKISFLISILLFAGCGSGGNSASSGPSIGLSIPALTFDSPGCGSNPAAQTFEISNSGGGTLSWSFSNRPSWLLLTPESGTAPATVTAQVDAVDLACGQTYSQTLQINAAGTGNTPVSFTATLLLGPAPPLPPTLGVHPGTMELQFAAAVCGGIATSAAPSFDVVNAGTGTFNWSAAADQPWIQFSPPSGVPGASVTVQTIDSSNFPCGVTSSGVIQISSSEAVNSPIAVTVKVIVPSPANMTPSVAALPFFATRCKASPPARQFTIQNTGGTPLGWSAALTYAGAAAGWAAVDSLSGTVAAGETSGPITVTADASGLACGQGYSATLTLTATSGGNAVSPVLPKTVPIGLSNPTAWGHQHPTPTGDHLKKAVFSEPGIAWAVGEGGTLLHSDDSGNHWTRVASGTMANLNAIAFAGPAEGWIAGSLGTVGHTTDGGASWTLETSGVTQELFSLFILDAANVWGVGKNETIIYRNNDPNWINKSITTLPDPSHTDFKSIFMNDATHGWMVGKKFSPPAADYLLWSDDNWTTVQPQTIPQNPNAFASLSSLFFLPQISTGRDGWAVGDIGADGNGTILQIHSNDLSFPGSAGAQASGTPADLGDIYFSDPSHGWAVGENGTIIQTSNGGGAWAVQASGSPPEFLKSLAFNSGNGLAVGFAGSILNTSDGSNWVARSAGTMNQLNALSFAPDGLHGWAVGSVNTVLATSNGGNSWTADPTTHSGTLTGVHAVAANQVWAVATNRNIYYFNGTSWGLQAAIPGGVGDTLNGLFLFVDPTNTINGWAVGKLPTATSNQIYYYDGTSWLHPISIPCAPATTTMKAVHFIGAAQGWVAGSGGIVAQTSNNGGSWTCAVVDSSTTWNSIYFINTSVGWAVGSGGKIFSTDNGGSSWTAQTNITWLQSSNGSAPLNKIYFVDATHGWIAGGTEGASGFVLATSDGGLHWIQQPVATTQALNAIYFKDANEGWAVGNNGTIVHTTLGGQ